MIRNPLDVYRRHVHGSRSALVAVSMLRSGAGCVRQGARGSMKNSFHCSAHTGVQAKVDLP